ncbi:hypothetical protein [Paraburkholderia sp.]|uniref:hypothetical protein n=1 Tax=Paraburkholderia sp. TaxID=1926495 RepID=UPI003C76E14B
MIGYWKVWASSYPLVSLEDRLADSDWLGFATITKELGVRVQKALTMRCAIYLPVQSCTRMKHGREPGRDIRCV